MCQYTDTSYQIANVTVLSNVFSIDVSADDTLGLLVNRPPEFEDPLPMLVTFEKNTTEMQEF